MDFETPERIRELLPGVRAFLRDEVIPLEAALRHELFAALGARLREEPETPSRSPSSRTRCTARSRWRTSG